MLWNDGTFTFLVKWFQALWWSMVKLAKKRRQSTITLLWMRPYLIWTKVLATEIESWCVDIWGKLQILLSLIPLFLNTNDNGICTEKKQMLWDCLFLHLMCGNMLSIQDFTVLTAVYENMSLTLRNLQVTIGSEQFMRAN